MESPVNGEAPEPMVHHQEDEVRGGKDEAENHPS